jgi:hypothetical protein
MKKSEQLKGWAVDRATEILKIGATQPVTFEMIKELADKLCDYCFDQGTIATIDAPEVQEETVQ